MDYQVLLFYKYVTINNPKDLLARVRSLCEEFKLKGRIIISEEGINATVEGLTTNTERFAEAILSQQEFSDIKIKRSRGNGNAFPKLSIKIRPEIVGTKFSKQDANPEIKTAPRISSAELKTWYDTQKDFVVIDMRNSYEFESGHFKNSIDPGLNNSRDLPKVIDKLSSLKDKTVLTVCTGGVRCEKMSAFLMNKGFKDVYQLEEGIHSYMEKYPGEDFLGALYTFDQRVTMDFGGKREIIGRCRLCGNSTEKYVNCANNDCHLHFIACEKCQDSIDGRVYCSSKCRAIVKYPVFKWLPIVYKLF